VLLAVPPLVDVALARPAASVAAATRACVAEPVGDRGAERFSDAAEPWPPMFGHPWKATNALAKTNAIAAPARSEPAVPNPAMYARVARMPSVGIGSFSVGL
jgi:hypothetical protein